MPNPPRRKNKYHRITLNLKEELKEHRQALKILNKYQNKTACMVRALIALEELESSKSRSTSETEMIRQLVREELSKHTPPTPVSPAVVNDKEESVKPNVDKTAQTVPVATPSTQEHTMSQIDQNSKAKILKGLGAFKPNN